MNHGQILYIDIDDFAGRRIIRSDGALAMEARA